MKTQIEGYWNDTQNNYPEYPMPVPNVLSQDEANRFADMIESVQKFATENRYRGPSVSRITGERLGCAEYELDGWRWPGDFAHHYVRTHRVKPTDAFMDFISRSITK